MTVCGNEKYISYALFDFDGTLIGGDSIVLFLRFAYRKGLATLGDILRAILAGLGFKLGLLSTEGAKRSALRFLKGREASELRRLSNIFVSDMLAPRLRADGLKELARQREAGRTILLVSASPDFYLEPLKSRFGIDDIIATRMDTGDNGVFTGLVCGESCRGLQKPLRLAEYLASKGALLDYEGSVGFGDSRGDIPMLMLCKRRVAVNPKRGLKKALKGVENAEIALWR